MMEEVTKLFSMLMKVWRTGMKKETAFAETETYGVWKCIFGDTPLMESNICKTGATESNIFYFCGSLSAGMPMDKKFQSG